MSAVAFARIWYASSLVRSNWRANTRSSVNPDEWFLALTVLAEAAIRKEPSILVL